MAVAIISKADKVATHQTTITISGTVIDPASSPLKRVVLAYYSGDLSLAVGITNSDASDGSFSFDLNGTVNTEFTCIAQGELGENCVVHSHKTAG